MHQSVQASLCDELTLEHIVTISDRKLTGKDECLSAVLVVDYLLKVVLDLIIQLNHPKVINNQHILVVELSEEVSLSSLQVHKFEILYKHIHCEVHDLDSISTCSVS